MLWRSRADSLSVLGADPQVDVSRLDIRIGRIVSVRKHPLAETLYVQEVDMGEPAPRTVVSKLGLNIDPEQFENSPAVFLCNIRPSKIRGVTSHARLLCGSASDSHIELLAPPPGAVPGDRVTCRTFPGEADRQLLPRERVWDRLQGDLRTDARGVATYKGAEFEVKGKGQCKAPTLSDCVIKST
ncbi:aminoacyl tRNA synthase complex-interacting multifunctional protein 1-like [Aplochiton taeniatus]